MPETTMGEMNDAGRSPAARIGLRDSGNPGIPGLTLLGLVLILLLTASPTKVAAQANLLNTTIGPGQNSRLVVTAAFSGLPSCGYLPLKVEVVNNSKQDLDWAVRCSSSSSRGVFDESGEFTSSFTFSVGARKSGVFELMVPLLTIFEDSSPYSNFEQYFTVDLSCQFGSWRGDMSTVVPTSWPIIAYSGAFSSDESSLNGAYRRSTKSSSSGPHLGSIAEFGAMFDPASLPSDWRGFSGFDALMITSGEWVRLAPGARTAILDWNRLGGNLIVYSDDPSQTLATLKILPEGSEEKSSMRSLGKVELKSWNGNRLQANSVVSEFGAWSSNTQMKRLNEDYVGNWDLRDKVGETGGSPVFIIIILIAFGIIVGPVNLFAWAGPGKRHRLFITTPLISLVTSIILGLLILFQDGLGGTGARLVLIDLESGAGENKAYISQTQITRTGVIFGNAFETETPMFISPVALSAKYATVSSSTGKPKGPRIGVQGQYQLTGEEYDGDWFKSRSLQGQFLKSVKSTRARIELENDPESPAPVLFSSLGFDVASIFYLSPSARPYRGGALKTGGKQTLAPCEMSDISQALTDAGITGGSVLGDRLSDALKNGRSLFVAFGSEAGDLPVETLDTTDWEHSSIVLFGTIAAPASSGGDGNGGN